VAENGSGWGDLVALTDNGVAVVLVLGLCFLAWQWLKLRGNDRPANEYLERFERIAVSMEEVSKGVAVLVARLEWQGERSHDEHEGLRVGLAGALQQTQTVSKDYTATLHKTLEEQGQRLDKMLDYIAPREAPPKRAASRRAPARKKVSEIMHDAPHEPKARKQRPQTA
jgi:hypothetical protein